MARPSSLTPAVQRRITDLVRQGAHPRQAARSAGVPESTFSGWLANPGASYEDFRDAILQAEAEAELGAVKEIRELDPKWWLERRHRDRWGRQPESHAQAAAVLQIGAASEPPPAPSSELMYFTPDELRRASLVFLNRKRLERGEEPLIEDPADKLRGLVEDASQADGGETDR